MLLALDQAAGALLAFEPPFCLYSMACPKYAKPLEGTRAPSHGLSELLVRNQISKRLVIRVF